jgi:hypothetical protein
LKNEVVKALDIQIKETNAKLENLLEARELLTGPKKERKKRSPKKELGKDAVVDHLKKNDPWPPEPKKKIKKSVVNPPLDDKNPSAT